MRIDMMIDFYNGLNTHIAYQWKCEGPRTNGLVDISRPHIMAREMIMLCVEEEVVHAK